MAPEAVPEVTEVPFTLTVAVAVATVGVTVIEATELTTLALYSCVVALNVGAKVPEIDRAASLALLSGGVVVPPVFVPVPVPEPLPPPQPEAKSMTIEKTS
jgi:hypothetical protein